MPNALQSLLRPVHLRQRWQRVLGSASLGLFLGSAAGCLLGLSCLLARNTLFREVGLTLLVLGPLAGALLGWLAKTDWGAAARAVDRAGGLKDCTVSALDFAARSDVTPFHELTARDAVRHLEGVRPDMAAPLRWPRSSPWAAIALALALLVLLQSGEAPAPAADLPGPPDNILKEAALIEQYARDVEKMGEQEHAPELTRLAAEMKKKAEEMRQPGVNVCEAMARISEMQQALAQVKAELKTPLIDGELKDLGSTLREAPPTEQPGKALEDAQLDQAARLLEALARGESAAPDKKKDGHPEGTAPDKKKDAPPEAKDERASRAAGEKTENKAKELAAKKLDKLGKAANKLATGLKGDDQKMKEGAKELADEVRQQERRKRINELLAREDRRLQDCKGRCEKQNLFPKRSQSGKPGQSQSQTQQRPGAEQPKDREGGAAAPPPREGSGQREQGAGNPKEQGNNGGKPAEGTKNEPGAESTGQTDGEPGGGKDDVGASRPRHLSPEKYRKLRKLTEAAIEDEAIPLGLRESIRKYFELLRPPGVDDDAPPQTPMP
jgi:hypothetical protein